MNINILKKYYKSDFSVHDFYYIYEKTLNIYQFLLNIIYMYIIYLCLYLSYFFLKIIHLYFFSIESFIQYL